MTTYDTEGIYTPLSFDDVDLTPLELEVLKRMRAVVEAKGYDYIYPHASDGDCRYYDIKNVLNPVSQLWEEQVDYAAPACIVGHLLAEMNLGETIDTVTNESGIDTIADSVFLDYPPKERTEALKQALVAAQKYQDSGETWGYALMGFEKTLASWVAKREAEKAKVVTF